MIFAFGISADMILDAVFHAWVIISLIISINSRNKLKNLPDDDDIPTSNTELNDGFDYPEFSVEDNQQNDSSENN